MATIQLTSRARQALQHVAQRGSNARAVRRAQALLWLDAGERVAQVAQRLGVSRPAVYAWIEQFQARASEPVPRRICDRAHVGRPATKQRLAQETVAPLLSQSPQAHGYRERVWTTRILQRQVEQQTGQRVSRDTIRRALHALRYRYKRPRYALARRPAHWRQVKGGSNAG